MTPRSRILPALALAALAVAGSLPLADAAEPTPAAWSPAKAPAPVTALSLSKLGGTLAVGNAQPDSGSIGLPIVGGGASDPADLRAYDLARGRLFNASENPGGKVAVAASRDGRIIVAAGSHVTQDALTYYRVPTEAQTARYAPQWTATLPGPANGVAVNKDGKYVAVVANKLVDERLVGVLRVYDDSKTLLLESTSTGRITSVAMSADGRYVVTGGAHHERDDPRTYGLVQLYRIPGGAPLDREAITPANLSEVTAVAITPDGKTYAALTKGGEVLVFRNAEAATPAPAREGVARENATARALALSEDGRIVAAGAGQELRVVRHDAGTLTRLWNASLPAAVTSVDVNATGRIVLAGVAGEFGGVSAFSPANSTAFWSLGGGAVSNVSVSADGRTIAYAQGNMVHAARLQSRVALLFETAPGEGVPTAPFVTTEPFKPVSFDMLVRNEGAYPETIRLVLPTPSHVTFRATRTEFPLDPGQSAEVQVTVTPQRLQPATYEYNLTARADGGAETNATLSFRISGTSTLKVEMQRAAERVVRPGDNDSIILSLVNEGNSATNVTVSVNQKPSAGDEWPVYLLDQKSFTMAAGGLSTVRVLVDVPPLAINGSTNRVTVDLTTPDGTTRQEVLYKVNPFVGVNVTVAGRTKFVYAAGEAALFNVTVTNTGSVAAQFAASHDTRGTVGRNWVTGLDVTPFTLEPGENRTLAVRVFAPRDGEIGDRAVVVVDVRSIPADPRVVPVSDNTTLFVNLVEPPLPQPKTQAERELVPAAGLVGVAVAALAGAALTRSGRWRR